MKIHHKDLREVLLGEKFSILNKSEFRKECEKYTDIKTKQWVESDYEDFSIYKEQEYLLDLFLCYDKTSQRAIIETCKYFKNIKDMKVLDDYCGCGLTSVHLLNDDFSVDCFINLQNQLTAFEKLISKFQFDKFAIVDKRVGLYDLIVSFEVCEHFKNPIDYLQEITKLIKPDGFLSFTATFNKMCIGHFNNYIINGVNVTPKEAGINVRKFLKENYQVVHKGFNSIPIIYKKIA